MLKKTPLVPFVLVTSLFALWGFANDITNPMVSAFKTVMQMSNFRASLVQAAFYGGYFTMALPAALFIRKYSYKSGILVGLALYAVGALMFYPAAKYEEFNFFLLSLYILTFGLAFLETTANPFILSMGEESTATQRLNLAQAFNPVGSLTGMFVAQQLILAALDSDDVDASGNAIFPTLDSAQQAVIRTHDLAIIRDPYVYLGTFVVLMFVVFLFKKMPEKPRESSSDDLKGSFGRLFKNSNYKFSVVAQMFYVAAQIMCWTFIIQYAERLGYSKAESQTFNIIAMVMFLLSRMICTYILKFVSGAKLLMLFGIGALFTVSGAILLQNNLGLYCLMGTSFFMSLMFPTIYGIGLKGLGDDAKIGSAGLVMAIVGGALMPPLQGALIDLGDVGFIKAENFSFILPLFCFVVVVLFGWKAGKNEKANAA
ncbi:L-fucose:H+ symporter permease [Marinilongibacter aquaticus]|uniref:L-fucose:H+ symporter permease n=1 Tax=Marinilongibacter aquaticus TaxID=2975157 RepID=UPI0021BD1780|nr:L-fucose:H+ symporter permease [Marinilongibacter aquaticus]UBM57723.1 L-fucose:H+ symporter permease [Marinilongibacter aquaticus]